MADGPSPEQVSKIETEQLLRQMNDAWVKALVRADLPDKLGVRGATE